jgi:UDP-glucose 4-epimerase
MDYCVKQGINRFVFASSAAVYGVVGDVAISEDLLCRPNTPYGAGKLACENYLQAYHSTYGLETIMLRYFNVYGPRQAYTESSVVINNFTNKLVNNEPPIIYGDGLQSRDFVHVSDIVQANMAALEKTDIAGESFNIASGKSYTINDILYILKQITGTEHIQHKSAAPREGDVRFGKASIRKATDKLGYMPKMSLYEGLKQFVEFTRNKSQTSSNQQILLKQFNQEKDGKI